jgi:hypothetical protein
MSEMLRGFIADIVSADPQCQIVAAPPGRSTLSDKLDETLADVVILGAGDSSIGRDQVGTLLSQHPATRVIVIALGGDRATVHDLQPHVRQIDPLSPAALLAAIKQPCASAWRGA